MQNGHVCQFLEYFQIFFFAYYFEFFVKKKFFSLRMLILLIQLYIIILSCNLCPVTLKLCRISMFHNL